MHSVSGDISSAVAVGVICVSLLVHLGFVSLRFLRKGGKIAARQSKDTWYQHHVKWWKDCIWNDNLGVRLSPEENNNLRIHYTYLNRLRNGARERLCGSTEGVDEKDMEVGTMGAFGALPNELLVHILSYLEPHNLAAISQTCHGLHVLLKDDSIWGDLVVRRWGHSAAISEVDRGPNSWHRVFVVNHLLLRTGGTLRRVAWNPIVGLTTTGEPSLSHFGGAPVLPKGEDWPACEGCGRRMSLLLQLDLTSLPGGTDGILQRRFGVPNIPDGVLQLFLCTRGCDTHAPLEGTSLARVVSAGSAVRRTAEADDDDNDGDEDGDGVVAFPHLDIVDWEDFVEDIGEYWRAGGTVSNQTTDRPHVGYYDFLTPALELTAGERALVLPDLPIPSEAVICRKQHPNELFGAPPPQSELHEEEFLVKPVSHHDKLGGFPSFAPGKQYPLCPDPLCSRFMDNCIFQVCSEHHIPWMFGDCGSGQVLQCPDHRHLLAFTWSF